MTRPSTPPILSELRTSSSSANQIKALRDLKNEIIGHEERKRRWIELGITAPLTRILNSHKGNGKKKYRDINGASRAAGQRSGRSDEDDARLQAIIIVGSFAHGGPAFLSPLYAGQVVSPLLALLSPAESHPQVIVQALKTLNTIADASRLSAPLQADHTAGLVALLYTHACLSDISSILQQSPSNVPARQQIEFAATLVCKTCSTEHHRALLAQSGVLDALVTNVASAVIASYPTASEDVGYPSTQHLYSFKQPKLAPLLKAVCLIIKGSKERAQQAVNAAALTSAFSKLETRLDAAQANSTAQQGNARRSSASQNALKAMYLLLPQLPNSSPRGSSLSHPTHTTFGSTGTYGRSSQLPQSLSTAIEVNQNFQGLEFLGDEESPLIPWLLFMFRNQDRATSLAAAEMLIGLSRCGLLKRAKESIFAYLLVPPLVSMLEKDPRSSSNVSHEASTFDLMSEINSLKEDIPAVLAILTSNNAETQKAAADAGAIQKLSELLKESFEPLPTSTSSSLWSPESDTPPLPQSSDDSCRLGEPGISPAAYHILRLRESIFAALAAIASDKDDYRKKIIDYGVMPYVIKTLKAEAVETAMKTSDQAARLLPTSPIDVAWNYREAVLAACGAARALSRSVSTLRTSLMDAGLAAPLFVLLKSQDVEIKIAATAVVCNLVLKFSPMREAIMDGGILTILCQHAHDANGKLRLNSMWALKHVIAGASNSVKMTCLEQLKPSWLKQILDQDIDPASPLLGRYLGLRDELATPMKLSTSNAAGEQVNLLNAVVEATQEPLRMMDEDRDEDLQMSDNVGGVGESSNFATKDQGRTPMILSDEREMGLFETPALSHKERTLTDEVAIQKEALEIVRNLICGENAPEMIDHMFRQFGQSEIFAMLAAKLRPRTPDPFNRERKSAQGGLQQIQPQPEIIVSVCYTLVHFAAGNPRQRQIMIQQTEILQLLATLFTHLSREVRTCCAWFVINLTWVEDAGDKGNAKGRARELARRGFFDKLEIMEKTDESLDCKERAKTAREQMRHLLQSS